MGSLPGIPRSDAIGSERLRLPTRLADPLRHVLGAVGGKLLVLYNFAGMLCWTGPHRIRLTADLAGGVLFRLVTHQGAAVLTSGMDISLHEGPAFESVGWVGTLASVPLSLFVGPPG